MRIRGSSQILDGTVVAATLASDSVTTVKILDLNVTTAKIAANAVTAAKADLSVTWNFTGALQSNGATVATQAYADAIAAGARPHESCRLATNAALAAYTRSVNTITADANGALTIDGSAAAVNDRILLKNGAAGADNGIYTVTATGGAGAPFILDRASDMNADSETKGGAYTFINEGTANADRAFVLTTNDPITLNTTALTFSDFATVAGVKADGTTLTKTGNTFSITAGGVGVTELAAAVAGAGLTGGAGSALDVVSANGGIVANANDIALTLDGTTLSVGASGVKVADSGITATQLAATVAGGGLNGGAGTALSVDEKYEVPAGTVNGANAAFTIASAALGTKIQLFLNGILQKAGGTHYTLTAQDIAFVAAPSTGDLLEAHYLAA